MVGSSFTGKLRDVKAAPTLMLAIGLVIGACAGPAPSTGPTATASGTGEPTADPAVVWHLVAAFDRGAEWAYSVRAATTEDEWSALWAELSPGLEAPAIDFPAEIVAVFADGTGGPGNCSERRLDGVGIDVPRELVYARISDPLAPRGCDAMLGGASVFVVALARAALPPMPFTLQLRDPLQCCEDTGRITVGEP
jgi:hypothetical protein